MRVLNSYEQAQVAGGTWGCLAWVWSWWCKPVTVCAPAPVCAPKPVCAPAPAPCAPAPTCKPATNPCAPAVVPN